MTPQEWQVIVGVATIFGAIGGTYTGIRVANAQNALLISALQKSFDEFKVMVSQKFLTMETNMCQRLDALEKSVERSLLSLETRTLRLEAAFFRVNQDNDRRGGS